MEKMKNARGNIPYHRFILFIFKLFSEIVTSFKFYESQSYLLFFALRLLPNKNMIKTKMYMHYSLKTSQLVFRRFAFQ